MDTIRVLILGILAIALYVWGIVLAAGESELAQMGSTNIFMGPPPCQVQSGTQGGSVSQDEGVPIARYGVESEADKLAVKEQAAKAFQLKIKGIGDDFEPIDIIGLVNSTREQMIVPVDENNIMLVLEGQGIISHALAQWNQIYTPEQIMKGINTRAYFELNGAENEIPTGKSVVVLDPLVTVVEPGLQMIRSAYTIFPDDEARVLASIANAGIARVNPKLAGELCGRLGLGTSLPFDSQEFNMARIAEGLKGGFDSAEYIRNLRSRVPRRTVAELDKIAKSQFKLDVLLTGPGSLAEGSYLESTANAATVEKADSKRKIFENAGGEVDTSFRPKQATVAPEIEKAAKNCKTCFDDGLTSTAVAIGLGALEDGLRGASIGFIGGVATTLINCSSTCSDDMKEAAKEAKDSKNDSNEKLPGKPSSGSKPGTVDDSNPSSDDGSEIPVKKMEKQKEKGAEGAKDGAMVADPDACPVNAYCRDDDAPGIDWNVPGRNTPKKGGN